jgi:uncharacterized protein (TIGR02301 family)
MKETTPAGIGKIRLAAVKLFRHKDAMRRVTSIFTVLALIAPLAVARPAAALDAPYEAGLMRIAEVMGSLHFLRNLCGDKGDQWRRTMERLLAAENPDTERRARFIASFNRGYRSFESTYTTCTASATEAIARYTVEGENLARDLASRYGN